MSKILSPQDVKFPIWLFQNNKMGHWINKWWPHFNSKIQNGVRQLYVAVTDGVIIADENGASDINGDGSKLFRANWKLLL